ncbi:MAG: diadenylate cyclase CdaA [Oscillospiraceae bacterium]|nr:diadenylate cyclase CdaA [Oscillospiraceae bacterium]
MYAVKNILNMVWNVMQSITFMDVIDILLMSYLVYLLIKLIRETRAGQLVKGILFIVIAYVISNLIGLKAMSYIIKSALDIGLLAILIMFQPEIRRALEKAGRSKIGITLFSVGETADQSAKWNTCIEAICDSCVDLSATKTGALIVIERQTKLGEQIENGTILNAVPSKELFGNIFFKNTPLHDGAVIIRDGMVLAAACFLPKPQKEELINKKLGSRHRAAIGMSENSDAIVIVVSEETGNISIAENGELTRDFTRFRLNEYLHEALIPKPSETKKKLPIKKRNRSKGDKK